MTRETQSKLLGEFYAEKKNILKLKGEDYANEDVLSNFKTAGANIGISAEQQCLSLIATKVARLGNLLSGKTPNNESISDSILDLSNYTDLLYCLVNEDDKPKQKSILKEMMAQDEKDGLYEAKTKHWENVDPFNPPSSGLRPMNEYGITDQIKWADIPEKHNESQPLTLEECFETYRDVFIKTKPIKEEDIFYKGGEPITEPYEPKVGNRFISKNERLTWEIESLDYNSVIIKVVGSARSKRYSSHQAFISDIENVTLKNIN
jgi:hypothetical protein